MFQTNQTPYDWQITDFVPVAVNETQSDLLIYELLLRDFDEAQNIQAATDKLDYFKTLGVNAIQLMPVIEFDGNESWGYAPNFFFLPPTNTMAPKLLIRLLWMPPMPAIWR